MPAARRRMVGRVVGAHVTLQHLGGTRGRRVGGGEDVLQRQRHAGQLAGRLIAGGQCVVNVGGRRQRLVGANVQECVDVAVDLADAVQVGLRNFLGADLARVDLLRQFRGGPGGVVRVVPGTDDVLVLSHECSYSSLLFFKGSSLKLVSLAFVRLTVF